MSKKLYEETSISAIADAIRNKNGSSDSYKVSQMANAILAINPDPDLESLSVNQNGNYLPSANKDGFSSVSVSVPNSYAAGDEGKVVKNGVLAPQTSRTISDNGTYDTTENDEVVVQVSGGGGSATLISKNITQNGIYLAANDNADGYSYVDVNVQGSGGTSGVYTGTTDPDSSIGSNGDYYYKRSNKFDAIQNRGSLSTASGSQTFVYGIEFYVTNNCAITKLRGFTTEARTGKLRIGTTSNILAEKTCSFEANKWTEVTLDTPVSLTKNEHYIVQIEIDRNFTYGKIGYMNSVIFINYSSIVRYVSSRYGSFPGTVEQNSAVMVDFTIERDNYIVVNQYRKENGTWVQID